MTETNDVDNLNEAWVLGEQNFMRYSAGAMFVVGVVSIFSGVLANPEDTLAITAFNGVLTGAMFLWGGWTFWRSMNLERIKKNVEKSLQRSTDTSGAIAAVQGFVGILFLLEGISGNVTLLLLALGLFYSAWWTSQRRNRVKT